MTPGMGLKIGQLGERFVAAGIPAFVRFVTGVSADVLLKMGQLSELPLTDLAAVRLYAQVNPGVLRQVRTVRERFRALGAFVRFGFFQV